MRRGDLVTVRFNNADGTAYVFSGQTKEGVDLTWTPLGQFDIAIPDDERDLMELVTEETSSSEGRKNDSAKPRLDLIPPEAIFALGEILSYGAEKYSARNWEKGMSWGRVFGAGMRHLWAWWGGEKADAETGRSHLWHALCCVAFLVAYEERNIGTDDRNKGDKS